MKQVKLSDVKKVLGCENNNDLVQELLRLYHSNILRCQAKGYDLLSDLYDRRWNALFDLLENVGYYDVKEN